MEGLGVEIEGHVERVFEQIESGAAEREYVRRWREARRITLDEVYIRRVLGGACIARIPVDDETH